MYGLENVVTIILSVVGVLIVTYAQTKINSTYSKYKKINVSNNLTGKDVARQILDSNGLTNIKINQISGDLSDHYDPTKKCVNLSSSIYDGNTIAGVSVAAHECGHALQDKDNYTFMRIRASLVPVVNLVSYLGYFSIIVSLIAGITGYLKVGIFIILATLLFQLVTLPVEFNASNRAKKELLKLNLVSNNEIKGTNKMLGAAAFTYVASVISSLINLLRLVIMLGNRED